jgi:hypothetical protein
MATSIIPKSEMRRYDSVSEGYGEVPGYFDEETGEVYYGLPGGLKTTCRQKALEWARKLDTEIRKRLVDPRQLLSVV